MPLAAPFLFDTVRLASATATGIVPIGAFMDYLGLVVLFAIMIFVGLKKAVTDAMNKREEQERDERHDASAPTSRPVAPRPPAVPRTPPSRPAPAASPWTAKPPPPATAARAAKGVPPDDGRLVHSTLGKVGAPKHVAPATPPVATRAPDLAGRALLLGSPQSSRDRVRAAMLWSEVLARPKALRARGR
jgi:hypothetical protein